VESTFNATPIVPTRQELLKAWMDRDKKSRSFRKFASRMGITGVSLGRLCAGETIPTERHRKLVELGVPTDLLPRPEDLRPGRPRKLGLHDEFAAAFKG